VERGEMTLSDGRKILPAGDARSRDLPNVIPMHPDFRVIVLANRPGFPFLGNDFFATLGKFCLNCEVYITCSRQHILAVYLTRWIVSSRKLHTSIFHFLNLESAAEMEFEFICL